MSSWRWLFLGGRSQLYPSNGWRSSNVTESLPLPPKKSALMQDVEDLLLKALRKATAFQLGRHFWSKEGMFLAMQTTCWNPNSKYGFWLSKNPYHPCMVCFVYWRFRCDWNHPELIWWQQHVCWAVCQRTGDDAGPWEAIEKRHWASRMLSCLATGLQGHWGWSTVLWLNLPFTTYTASNLNFPRYFRGKLKRPSYQSKFRCAVINVFHKKI